MSGFWNTPPQVKTFPNASIALAELALAKRGESDSRLRLHQVQWNEAFDQLLLSVSGLSVELALGYVSFVQLCRILDLQAEIEFLRGLHPTALPIVLQQYTGYLDPYEVKLVVHKREVDMFNGSKITYYEIKRMASAKGGNSHITTEHWLYCLTLLEQAGWLWASPLLVQDDLLVAALYNPALPLVFKGGNTPAYRGILLTNSEAGLQPSRMLPTVCQPEERMWLPVMDTVCGDALIQDLSDLLDGRIGMFGLLPHYTGILPTDVVQHLSAYASVTVTETAMAELLIKGGMSRKGAIDVTGEVLREGVPLTGYRAVSQVLREELCNIVDDPVTVVNHAVKLGAALWA